MFNLHLSFIILVYQGPRAHIVATRLRISSSLVFPQSNKVPAFVMFMLLLEEGGGTFVLFCDCLILDVESLVACVGAGSEWFCLPGCCASGTS